MRYFTEDLKLKIGIPERSIGRFITEKGEDEFSENTFANITPPLPVISLVSQIWNKIVFNTVNSA